MRGWLVVEAHISIYIHIYTIHSLLLYTYIYIYKYIHKYTHPSIYTVQMYRSIHQYIYTSSDTIESNELFDNCEEMASRGAVKTFMAWATNKEHGMLTTHFWGPVANWGLVGSAVYDASFQGPEVRAFLTSADRRSFFFHFLQSSTHTHTHTHTHR